LLIANGYMQDKIEQFFWKISF